MRVSNCTEFEAYLHAAVEERTCPDEAALTEHARGCAACRQRLDEFRLLDRAVSAWKADVVEVDLVDAILAQHAFNQSQTVEAEPSPPATTRIASTVPEPGNNGRTDNVTVYLHPTRPSNLQPSPASHSRGVYAVLAVAAVLMVVVANPFSRPESDLPPTQNVAITDVPTQPDEPVPPEADVETIVRDAGTAYIELARGAADIFTDTVVLIPEPVIPQSAGDAGTNEASGTQPWGEELAPIRRDVGHAIDFLFNTITNEDEPAT
jgi:hypothetical protein